MKISSSDLGFSLSLNGIYGLSAVTLFLGAWKGIESLLWLGGGIAVASVAIELLIKIAYAIKVYGR